MARDYAKKGQSGRRKSASASRSSDGGQRGSWRWFGAGMLSGIFLSFLIYLGTLAPDHAGTAANPASDEAAAEASPPKPRFDFYTILPEQSIEVDIDPAEVARSRSDNEAAASVYYLLQAGSFRNPDDADSRRGELTLLGLSPRVEEASGDNGRWFRVYVGPFQTRSAMNRARSLAMAENIETLVLKRNATP
ncbi:MAG: SPOR domain-containing protein [Pseudomonadota bacterium]